MRLNFASFRWLTRLRADHGQRELAYREDLQPVALVARYDHLEPPEPILTAGFQATTTANVGDFSAIDLQATECPLEVLFFHTSGSPTTSFGVTTTDPLDVAAVGIAEWTTGGTLRAVARQGHGNTAIGGSWPYLATSVGQNWQMLYPILVLPGERFVLQQQAANTAFTAHVVYREYPAARDTDPLNR